MLRRALIASLPLALIAAAALADAPAGQFVDMSPVALPVVVNRKLVNYVFVYIRINLTPGANLAQWRDREPYFRDALVKLAHRTPFNLPNDPMRLDEARLKTALFQAASDITGPGQVASIAIMPGGGPMKRINPAPAAH